MQAPEALPPSSPCRAEYAEQARKLCLLLGATDEELARFFDVEPETLRRWLASDPAFAAAVAAGRERADAEVADRYFRRALGYSVETVRFCLPADALDPVPVRHTVHYPPSPSAGNFWLRNRQHRHWRDTATIEAKAQHDPDDFSDEELAAIAAGGRGRRDPAATEDPQ